jgi:hypothetical protein
VPVHARRAASLVIHGAEATILDRRPIRAVPDDDLETCGCCAGDEGIHLDPELLRRAARRVEDGATGGGVPRLAGAPGRDPATRAKRGPGAAPSALDSAVALGRAVGVLCARAGDASVAPDPAPRTLDAIADLAATAVTISAPPSAPSPGAAMVERSWALTRALARAGAEPLWDGPGNLAWPDWLGDLIAATSDALLACAESVDGGATAIAAVHREHCPTPDEHRTSAAGALVTVCLQALALLDPTVARPC